MNPNVEAFLAELLKLFGPPPNPTGEMPDDVKEAYKAHGFDPDKPPSDSELAKWATQLIYAWHKEPGNMMNLPIAGLCIGYNMTTWGKLTQMDQMNLRTLLCSVYNMGYCMGTYNMRNPFDKKPQPQELN